MDPRIKLASFAGVDGGPDFLITNAGGLVTEEVRRELGLSRQALGIYEIWVVMHTDCQMQGLDDNSLLASIEAETGRRPTWTPGGFQWPEAELRLGIARLRSERLLAGVTLRGFLLDLEAGRLEEVECAA